RMGSLEPSANCTLARWISGGTEGTSPTQRTCPVMVPALSGSKWHAVSAAGATTVGSGCVSSPPRTVASRKTAEYRIPRKPRPCIVAPSLGRPSVYLILGDGGKMDLCRRPSYNAISLPRRHRPHLRETRPHTEMKMSKGNLQKRTDLRNVAIIAH